MYHEERRQSVRVVPDERSESSCKVIQSAPLLGVDWKERVGVNTTMGNKKGPRLGASASEERPFYLTRS